MTDIPLEDILDKADNVYEAVVTMCKRARQVTDEQKHLIEMEMESVPVIDNRENEDFDDVEIDREALMREHKKYPKPSRVVMEEMIKGEIEYHYDDDTDEVAEEPEKEMKKQRGKISKSDGASKDTKAPKESKATKSTKKSNASK